MEKLPKINTTFIICLIAFIISGIFSFVACADSQEVPPIVVTEVFNIAGEEIVVTRILEPTPTPTVVPTAPADNNQPVILDVSFVRSSVPNIDPQLTTDPDGIDLIENMFVGLTRYNHVTNQVGRLWPVLGMCRKTAVFGHFLYEMTFFGFNRVHKLWMATLSLNQCGQWWPAILFLPYSAHVPAKLAPQMRLFSSLLKDVSRCINLLTPLRPIWKMLGCAL